MGGGWRERIENDSGGTDTSEEEKVDYGYNLTTKQRELQRSVAQTLNKEPKDVTPRGNVHKVDFGSLRGSENDGPVIIYMKGSKALRVDIDLREIT